MVETLHYLKTRDHTSANKVGKILYPSRQNIDLDRAGSDNEYKLRMIAKRWKNYENILGKWNEERGEKIEKYIVQKQFLDVVPSLDIDDAQFK